MIPRSTAFERSTLPRPDEPTIYCFQDKNANHYVTDEPTIYCFRDKNVLVSKVVDRGFIGGVMISVLVSKVVDRGFIGGGLTFLSRKQ
jgi:hypothetical protein